MIIVTGAAGFIGSYLISELLKRGYKDIYAVDDFSQPQKWPNLRNKDIAALVHRDHLLPFLEKNAACIQTIYHLGARTDTQDKSYDIFQRLNVDYSKAVFSFCAQRQITLVYASSAATYGGGEYGFIDSHDIVQQLHPLNAYAISKNEFDKWALGQNEQPTHWFGLKFFNVFGPNEYHKGRMASVIFHAFHQILKTGEMKLFRSHRKDVADGAQKRDFVYVKDIADMCIWMSDNRPANGLYNAGTGAANTFYDLARFTFEAMDVEERISYIDTPLSIRDAYQYYTQANMLKLHAAGYEQRSTPFKTAVFDYVRQYLRTGRWA